MAGWYSAGTVTVTNGSTVVTGVGTDFVSNVNARDAFALTGGNPNEIASVQSATQLTLARPWLGGTNGGQAYVIIPTNGIYIDLALRALNMLTPFQAVLDGIGRGLMLDGTAAAPGVRFASDQDSGLRRYAENGLSMVTGGVDRMTVDATGNVGIGGPSNLARLQVAAPAGVDSLRVTDNTNYTVVIRSGGPTVGLLTATPANVLAFGSNNIEQARIDLGGNFLVGATSGSTHTIVKGGAANDFLLNLSGNNHFCAQFYSGSALNWNGAAAVFKVSSNASTGRSISAGGTINASGADYAEYIRKAAHCGTILKGDVCGINRDGELVRTWADAVRFVVKSTDPNLVGGDTWAAHLPPRPDAAEDAPIEPIAPAPIAPAAMPVEPVREEGEEDLDFIRRMAAYLVQASAVAAAITEDHGALASYQAAAAAYPAAKAKYDAAVTVYEADLAAWEDDLEAARQTVDRIAFSGQVPVNVDDATLAACEAALDEGVAVYLVAVARGAGIGVSAIRESDMTLPLYMRRIGAVWAIRDGRPWVDVQHG